MKKILFYVVAILYCGVKLSAQEASLQGKVVDAATYSGLPGANIAIEGSFLETVSEADGSFRIFGENFPTGAQLLVLSRSGYATQRIPVTINSGEQKDLDLILMEPDPGQEQQMGNITLSDSELDEDEGGADNVSALLQASRDVFLNASAFDFSATFFRPRGLDSEFGKLLINGIGMNKFYNGRPQWADWGGLNDVQRNQNFSMGLAASEETFGGLAGTTNIIMRASQYSRGGKISVAGANRSYSGRLMATYNSGERKNGWYYSVSASRRFAKEAYTDGTVYDANSFFASVEKKINPEHSLNFTAFYTPNIRGKASANTDEVFELLGRRYNSYWGYQNGEIRNSRLREIKEPVLILNHFWKLSEKAEINTNLAYQFGKVANTHIDYGGTRLVLLNGQESYLGGGSNPDPAYYQKLPSYFLRFPDNSNYEAAYLAEQNFRGDGQLDWEALYTANLQSVSNGGNAIYILSEDRNDDQNLTANFLLAYRLNESTKLNAGLSFSRLRSENFAAVRDLLGGNAFLDIDFYAEGDPENSEADLAQNDLQHRNRLAGEGDRYKYNYELSAEEAEAFVQFQVKLKHFDLFAAAQGSGTQYQREGIYQNGVFPENSLGKSEELEFFDFGFKSGAMYKLSGGHFLEFNSAFLTRPPNLRNSFANVRQNNRTVANLESEKILAGDFSYRYRSSFTKLRLTGYYFQMADGTEVSFYYADGLSGLGRNSTTAFVQEVLTGVGKRHVGLEFGAEAQLTSALKLKAVAAIGEFIYNKDPQLYLTSNTFQEPVNYGRAALKNYHLAGGPQQAVQLGFEYRDPQYWWFGASLNYFSHAYVDVSPLTRTSNFFTDADGLPILNYDQQKARDLLEQEQFDDYFLLNAVGGKSWRLKSYYLGFFMSINNILDELYKTGGFEQARNANYRSLLEDKEREQPLFGSRYWYGNGATWYANLYFRF
ncbi:MAG: TonB-dependent receptor [Salegentibacter sp.]